MHKPQKIILNCLLKSPVVLFYDPLIKDFYLFCDLHLPMQKKFNYTFVNAFVQKNPSQHRSLNQITVTTLYFVIINFTHRISSSLSIQMYATYTKSMVVYANFATIILLFVDNFKVNIDFQF